MIGEKPKGIRAHLTLSYPALMLGIFFIIPFGLMAAVSFFHRQPGGFYIPGFELGNYQNLITSLFGRTLVFSLFVAGLSAARRSVGGCVCLYWISVYVFHYPHEASCPGGLAGLFDVGAVTVGSHRWFCLVAAAVAHRRFVQPVCLARIDGTPCLSGSD
jgi:hypothetical protein